MKVVAVIQARMGSTRLPGKVLRPILGKSMLELMVERVKRAKKINQIVIATTRQQSDDLIAELAQKLKLGLYRGSTNNVLSRFYYAVNKYQADAIIRLTADCPLIDPQVIDQIVSVYEHGQFDYVSNITTRTFPRGLDTEIFSRVVLNKIYRRVKTRYDQEHVTAYIYTHPLLFRLHNVSAPKKLSRPEIRLTVDTLKDFKLVRLIYARLYKVSPQFTLQDILEYFDKHPKVANLNRDVEQKTVFDFRSVPLRCRPVSEKDLNLIYSWSNDQLTRQMSFTSQPITLLRHKEWFNKMLKSNNIFNIIEINLNRHWLSLGQFRFNPRLNQISFSLAPRWRGFKLALPALNQAVKTIRSKFPQKAIIALIKSSNQASRKIFRQTGFKYKTSRLKIKQKCLQYELKPAI